MNLVSAEVSVPEACIGVFPIGTERRSASRFMQVGITCGAKRYGD